jgi:hypothetical protein
MKTKELELNTRRLKPGEKATLSDPRIERVLGFLAAKQFLVVPGVIPHPRARLPIEDVLHVARTVEPRVFEVFPAAYIRYPKSFLHIHKIPMELRNIIRAIRLGEKEFTGFGGIEYTRMKRWAERHE